LINKIRCPDDMRKTKSTTRVSAREFGVGCSIKSVFVYRAALANSGVAVHSPQAAVLAGYGDSFQSVENKNGGSFL